MSVLFASTIIASEKTRSTISTEKSSFRRWNCRFIFSFIFNQRHNSHIINRYINRENSFFSLINFVDSDVQKSPPPSNNNNNKRYVSSFKTLVNSTSSKHSQKLNYVNDSVIILKLSKESTSKLDFCH